MEEQLRQQLLIAVRALEYIKEFDPGPAHYNAAGALDEMREIGELPQSE